MLKCIYKPKRKPYLLCLRANVCASAHIGINLCFDVWTKLCSIQHFCSRCVDKKGWCHMNWIKEHFMCILCPNGYWFLFIYVFIVHIHERKCCCSWRPGENVFIARCWKKMSIAIYWWWKNGFSLQQGNTLIWGMGICLLPLFVVLTQPSDQHVAETISQWCIVLGNFSIN